MISPAIMDSKHSSRGSAVAKDKLPTKPEHDKRHGFQISSGQLAIPRPLVSRSSLDGGPALKQVPRNHSASHQRDTGYGNIRVRKHSSKPSLRQVFSLPAATQISSSGSSEVKSILKTNSCYGSLQSSKSDSTYVQEPILNRSRIRALSDSGNKFRAGSTISSDSKCLYRLPDQPIPNKLRKTVSFKDEDCIPPNRPNSQSFTTPIIGTHDTEFRLDQVEKRFANL